VSFYFSGNVVDQNGVPVVGAKVYVYAGGVLATLLEDANGNPLANPLTTGANGFYEAYSQNGGSHVLRIFWGGRERYVESIGEAVIQGPVAVKTITGTAYTLTRDDAYKVLRFTSNSAITLTVPSDATANIPVGAGVEVHQKGTGQITFAAGSGATLHLRGSFNRTAGQFAVAGLRKDAANTFSLAGDLA
jgi:hypothetical protein